MTSRPSNHVPESRSFGMSRRRALASLAFAVVATAGIFPRARRWFAGRRAVRHNVAPPDPSPLEPALLERMATFIGALFGHRLDTRDTRDVADGIALLAQRDGGWRSELADVADYVDRLARTSGAATFREASDDVRDQIVDAIMRPPVEGWRSDALALVSRDERVRRRFRSSMIGRLTIIYTASPPTWRRRGYTRALGQPGDPREYTRPGAAPTC